MGIGENVKEMKKANRKKGVRNTQSQKSQRENVENWTVTMWEVEH